MFFLTDIPVVEGSSTDIITLIVLLLGGGALGFDRLRNRNNHKGNPGYSCKAHDETEKIIGEIKDTRRVSREVNEKLIAMDVNINNLATSINNLTTAVSNLPQKGNPE